MATGDKPLSGVEKAALLIMQLQDDIAGKVLKAMHIDEVTKISTAMSNLGVVSSEDSDAVVTEAYNILSNTVKVIGNADNTKDILIKIFGEEEAEKIITDIEPNIWNKLAKLDPEKLSLYLSNENPQIIALVLQKLPESNISKILAHLSQDLAIEVILSFKNIPQVNKDMIESIESTINHDFKEIASQERVSMIANVLDNMNRESRSSFMKALAQKDNELVTTVKEHMFTFENLIKIEKKDIQILFRIIDKETLAIALKGADLTLQQLFFDNISSRAANIIRDDMEDQGPIGMDQIEAAQQEIAYEAKKLLNAHEIKSVR